MLAGDDTLDPRFPPELERMIFELAATASPKSVVMLGLVAWRVHHWIANVLFRTIVVVGDIRPVPYGHLRPRGGVDNNSFPRVDINGFQRLVRMTFPAKRELIENLILADLSPFQVVNLCSMCGDHLRSLTLSPAEISAAQPGSTPSWPSSLNLPVMLSLRNLSHLSVGVYDLINFVAAVSVRKAVTAGTLFSKISHLRLLSANETNNKISTFPVRRREIAERWPLLAKLPALRYLAVDIRWRKEASSLLANCKNILRALLVDAPADASRFARDTESDDLGARLVVYVPKFGASFEQDWMDALRGREDVWERAERFLLVAQDN